VAEKVYEQFSREARLVSTAEDEAIANAIIGFVERGRKEELIAYAAHALTLCGLSINEVMTALRELMDYRQRRTEPIWPWEAKRAKREAESDAITRINIVKELITQLSECSKSTNPNDIKRVMFLFYLGKFFHAFPRLAEFSQGRGRRIPWEKTKAQYLNIIKYISLQQNLQKN